MLTIVVVFTCLIGNQDFYVGEEEKGSKCQYTARVVVRLTRWDEIKADNDRKKCQHKYSNQKVSKDILLEKRD